MLRPLFSVLSPGGRRARLSTLIFHRVLPQPDPLFPGEMDAHQFDAICRWLGQWYRVLPLAQAVLRLREGTLPARAMAITFDDGYADNHGVALPILQRHGLPATFFVSTGFVDGGCMWNDMVIEAVRQCSADTLTLSALGIDGLEQVQTGTVLHKQQAIGRLLAALKYLDVGQRLACAGAIVSAAKATVPDELMMTAAQVSELARAGMQIGGHTVSHPILSRLSDADASAEIEQGRRQLESIAQAPVDLFAYPNGRPDKDYTTRDVALVKQAGFSAAVSTAWGVADGGADLYQLPRFTPWDRARWRFGLRLALNTRHPVQVCSPPAPGLAFTGRH